ncbi:hypothetical protein [Streptomyces sp. NPDC003688]
MHLIEAGLLRVVGPETRFTADAAADSSTVLGVREAPTLSREVD